MGISKPWVSEEILFILLWTHYWSSMDEQ